MLYTDKVALKELRTVDGTLVPNKRAVVNLDRNNAILGVVSSRYKIIHNTQLLEIGRASCRERV